MIFKKKEIISERYDKTLKLSKKSFRLVAKELVDDLTYHIKY